MTHRTAAAQERFDALKRAAGDFAVTDVVEADIFRELMAPERREALLQGAVARRWRSPRVFAELAGYAAAREAGTPGPQVK